MFGVTRPFPGYDKVRAALGRRRTLCVPGPTNRWDHDVVCACPLAVSCFLLLPIVQIPLLARVKGYCVGPICGWLAQLRSSCVGRMRPNEHTYVPKQVVSERTSVVVCEFWRRGSMRSLRQARVPLAFSEAADVLDNEAAGVL